MTVVPSAEVYGNQGAYLRGVSGGSLARLWTAATALLLLVVLEGVITASIRFVALNALLGLYLSLEIREQKRTDPRLWLVDPAVAASLATFMLAFVIPAVTLFIPDSYSYWTADFYLDGPDKFVWLNIATVWATAGAISMWAGYRVGVGASWGAKLARSRFATQYLRSSYNLWLPAAYVVVGVAVIARIFQASLGVYGYSSEQSQLTLQAAWLQVLYLSVSLMKIVMIALALAYFSGTKREAGVVIALVGAFLAEIIFGGFLAGFKGGVFFPVAALGTCYYWFHSRIPKSLVAGGLVLLFIAYTIVEPFRVLRNQDPNFSGRSLSSLANAVMTVVRSGGGPATVVDPSAPVSSFALTVGDRSNNTPVAAIAIKFKQERETLPEDAPKFLSNILLSPVLAVVPRALWQDKPVQNIGGWFRSSVLLKDFGSVAMSPIGYLYLAGGGVMVIAGFLFAGVFLRVLWVGLRDSAGGALIYLGLLPQLAFIDSAFFTLITGTLQLGIILFLVQRWLFRR